MTIQDLKNELEPIRRGGIKISEINIQNAIQRAIQKIVLKTTPLNLITQDTTIQLIKEIEQDGWFINKRGYYIRVPSSDETIDLDDRLLSALLYLVAYEFAPSKEQDRLLQQAQDEINSYKWYLYDLANSIGFDIDNIIEPYKVRDTTNGKLYTYNEGFIKSLDMYLCGNSIDSVRDKKYIDMYVDFADAKNSMLSMQELDKLLYRLVV